MSINPITTNLSSGICNLSKKTDEHTFENFRGISSVNAGVYSGAKIPKSGEFSSRTALFNFGKGLISPLTTMIQHPFMTIGTILAVGGAGVLVPTLAPIMLVGFGGFSVYEIAKGSYKAYSEYKKGNYQESERAFSMLGSGMAGAALSAIGAKSTAQIAAQVKRSAELGGDLIPIQKFVINEMVKKKSFSNALKENISILTTKRGVKGLLYTLRPRNILNNLQKTVYDFPVREVLYKKFSLTHEGKRRASMTHDEIKERIISILTKTFDDMGIPKNVRPKVVVFDHIRYLKPHQANDAIKQVIQSKLEIMDIEPVEVFKPNEILADINPKVFIQRIRDGIAQHPEVKKRAVNFDTAIKRLLSFTRGTTNGFYKSANNTININLNAYRGGFVKSLDDVVCHEALHAKSQILRNSLPEEEVSAIIKESLLNSIKSSECAYVPVEPKTAQIMRVPKMSAKMRKEFYDFAEKFLYKNADDSDVIAYLNERTDLCKKACAELRKGKRAEAGKLEKEIKDLDLQNADLRKNIDELLSNNPEFVADNGGALDSARKVLFDYIKSHENRYIDYSNQSLTNVEKIPLSMEQLCEAIESTYGRLQTRDGNIARYSTAANFDDVAGGYAQYRNSYEEVLARNTAIDYRTKFLTQEMREMNLSEEQRNINQIILEKIAKDKEINTLSKAYYEAKCNVANHPANDTYKKELQIAQNNYVAAQSKLNKYVRKIKLADFVYSPNLFNSALWLGLNINKRDVLAE